MQTDSYISIVRQHIADGDLQQAIEVLRTHLAGDERLNEALQQSGRFQYIRKQIRLGIVSHEDATLTQNQIRFGLLDLLSEIEQEGKTPLPPNVAQELITEESPWWTNLHQVLKSKAPVSNDFLSVSHQYGWLIGEFLRKMMTKPNDADKHPPLRRLSFMAEAFQSSLRYLCFIQIAQLLQLGKVPKHPFINDFLDVKQDDYTAFDYLNLLLISTELLQSKTDNPFLPDIGDLVEEILDTESDLYETVLFLQHHRNLLLKNAIPDNGQLSHLLEEYLTGLVYWLYHLAFLAKYRLVSIKDINLNYRLGTAKNFNHQYGELHGFYITGQKFEYPEYSIEEEFTYNQSVLLFKGTSVQDCLDKIKDKSTYISLSPLLIDQSVFSPNDKQTPEIYYYVGSARRSYNFAEYKNEILVEGFKEKSSNKLITVKDINRLTPKFDELYKHIELVFSPLIGVGGSGTNKLSK